MFDRFPDREPTAYDDDWEDPPASGWFPKWVVGVGLAVALLAYGVVVLATGHARLGGRFPMDLAGAKATAYAVAVLGVGGLLHCHYFWGNIYHFSSLATVGKILSLLAFIGGAGYLIVRVGIWG